MPGTFHALDSHPESNKDQGFPSGAGSAARLKLEKAVGRELALRLVLALTGPHARPDQLTS
jgi:hypothetical protein